MSQPIRPLHRASRITHHASRITHHALRNYELRITNYASRFLLLTLCLLPLIACSPRPPAPSPIPPPTATSALQPTQDSPPPATQPATPPATPLATPPPAETTASPDQALALREEFAAEADLFPNATRYEIDLTVADDVASVTGHQRIAYTNTEDAPLDALYLRLFPNTPGYGDPAASSVTHPMTVTTISLDGLPVEPAVELNGSALRLSLEPPLEPGTGIELVLDFALAVPTEREGESGDERPSSGYRQLGYYDGVLALANAYPIIPVYDDEGWNVEVASPYGDALYSDTAFYTVRITAPAELMLAASGACTAAVVDPAGNGTWTCVTGPVRDFNAVLGSDLRVMSDSVDGVTVNIVFVSEHEAGAWHVLDAASEAVRLFNDRFGPYPFTELDVVETPTQAGGIEYPGLVVINTAYYDPISDRLEWVVVHEVIHQWWYSLVGNDQVDDPWLDEALTQYSTLLYFEERYGADVATRLIEQVFRQPYQELLQSDRDAPVGLPVAAYAGADYGPVVYQKGPLYFHELRQEVGERKFWRILEEYFSQNRYGVATPEDWLAAVKAVTRDEHRDLYERWILGTTN